MLGEGAKPQHAVRAAVGKHCSSARSILQGLQPLYVLLFAASSYVAFLLAEILPRMQAVNPRHVLTVGFWMSGSNHQQDLLLTIFFHFFFFLFLYSFRKASTTSPGRIPLNKATDVAKWRDGQFKVSARAERTIKEIVADLAAKLTAEVRALVQSMVVVERKKKLGLHRFCSFCTLYKPDRTHHCRICGKCTLRMDHHCPWLANCVGYGNYKYFILTLAYALVITLFVIFTMGSSIKGIVGRFPDKLEFLPVILVYGCLCLLAPVLFCFLSFHIYLTLNAMTTIEYREKKNSTDPFVQRRFEIAHLKYNHGYLKNLCHMFGPIHMWLVPYFNGNEGTYEFELKCNKEVKDKH